MGFIEIVVVAGIRWKYMAKLDVEDRNVFNVIENIDEEVTSYASAGAGCILRRAFSHRLQY